MTSKPTGIAGDSVKPTRLLAYLRVSTVEQAQRGSSLASQRQQLIDLARMKEWPEPIFFSDDGVSGAKAERPGLQRLLLEMRPGDMVAVTALDRLARSLKLLLIILDDIADRGAWFRAVRDDFDTSTAMGRFGLQLMGAVAELERGLIISRTQEGRQRKTLEGKATFKPMFGYRRTEDGRLEVDPESAVVVRFMFDLADSERLGDLTIRQRLSGRFTAPGGGAIWSPSTVGRLLTTAAYTSGKHATGIDCPPIIGQAQFDRVQARRKANRRLKRTPGDRWPLQGRIRCHCGGNWRCETPRPGKGRRVYYCVNRYRWSRHVMNGGIPCDLPRQPAEVLERSIWDALREALKDPASLAKALEVTINDLRGRVTELEGESKPIRDAIAEIDGERERINDLYRLGEMAREGYMDRRKDLLNRRDGFQGQLDAIGSDRLAEFESARTMLMGAEHLLRTLAVRTELSLPVDEFSIHPGVAESDELAEFRAGMDYPLGAVEDADIPAALSALLNHLHGQVVIKPDRAEVSGIVQVDVPLTRPAGDPPHTTHSLRGLG